MDNEIKVKLYEQWNRLDGAAQRVLTALPHQMTEAAERLDRERLAMRDVTNKIILERKS